MRRSLILTVAAVVGMVLLAMLVPMGVLVQSYALEDRLSRAALEVQATETVVSSEDRGAVAVYLDRINREGTTVTTVLYPDGTAVGPRPGEDARVEQARRTGQARVDDRGSDAEILVPVSLGRNSAGPGETPVVRVDVLNPGLGSGVLRAWLVLVGLGLLLLVGSLLLADRLGRSFVVPLRRLAGQAQHLEVGSAPDVGGPPEVQELQAALRRLVDRVEALLERERRQVSDLSHRLRTPVTALRLRIDGLPERSDAGDRARLGADLDGLQATVDAIVREARRSEREGLVAESDLAATVADRVAFWAALAEDQARPLTISAPAAPLLVRASHDDLEALVDVLLDNVFSHTPDGAALAVRVTPYDEGGELVVEDAGPGFPAGHDVTGRGASGSGSTGLGLAIVQTTAEESGGSVRLDRGPLGGARVTVRLGRAR